MNWTPLSPITITYLLRTEITKSHLSNRICQHCGVKTSTVTPSWLGGKRGAGVPGSRGTGYGVQGCRKYGVLWKTRGLVENTGSGGKHGVSVENTGSQWKTLGLSEKHGV